MWLSSLGRRTPAAYFVFTIVVFLLSALTVLPILSDLLFGKLSWQQLPLEMAYPIIALLLAFFCNRIFVVADTFERSTLWPGYLYALIVLCLANQSTGIESLIHGAIGILIVYNLTQIQYNYSALKQSFNVGFLITAAALFDNELMLAIPFLLYGLTNLKPLSFREYLLYLIGIATPVYFLLAYCFLIDDLSFWQQLIDFSTWFSFNKEADVWFWIQWGFALVMMVTALFLVFLRYNSLPVYIRRLASALVYFVGALVVIVMVSGFGGYLVFYLAPAFAFFSTLLMLNNSNQRRSELIHFIFVIAIVAIQILSLIKIN